MSLEFGRGLYFTIGGSIGQESASGKNCFTVSTNEEFTEGYFFLWAYGAHPLLNHPVLGL